MLRLDIGLTYDEYLEMAETEQLEFINKLNEESNLIENNLEKIRRMDTYKHIVVFAEPHCRDVAKTVPFLLKLSDLNNKISVKFLRKKGNEKLLEKLTGEVKIPTILILDNLGEVERKYVEFPKGVKEILKNTKVEETQEVVDNMRNGKYDHLIQDDLIKFITGEGYEYIRFDRKDK